MGNVLLAYPNRFGGTLSGGSWIGGAGLSNLLVKKPSAVAVAVSSAARDAWLLADLGESKTVGIAAIVNHNLSTTGQWRLRGYSALPAVYFDFTTAVMPSSLAFSRGSVATYTGPDGLVHTAGTNEPRYEYLNGRCLGLLMERSASNHLLHNRDLTQSAWTKTNCTVQRCPGADGRGDTGSRITATGSATCAQTLSSDTRAVSIFARLVSGSGTFSVNGVGLTLESVWQRFTVQLGTASNTGVSMSIGSGMVVDVDYVQAEVTTVGYGPTSPIETGASGSSRVMDMCYAADATVLGLSLTGGAVSARFLLPHSTAAGYPFTIGNNATGRYHGIEAAVAACTVRAYNDSGTEQAAIGLGALAEGTEYTVSYRWAANDMAATLDGGTVGTDTSVTLPTGTNKQLNVGYLVGSNRPGIIVQRIVAYGATQNNATLQSMCAVPLVDTPSYDSGWLDAWPAAWVSGTTAEQRSGVRGLSIHKPASPQSCRYWTLEFSEAASLGRVFFGDAYQPTLNMSYGASLGYEQRESAQESDSGAEVFVERPNPRVARFVLQYMSQAEGMGKVFEMQRQLGATGEVLFAWDPDDTLHLPRRAWLGRLRTLGSLEMPIYDAYSTPIEVKELL